MTKLFLEETKEELKKNNMRSDQSGVTMVTIVITIIVMLILIMTIFGNSGDSISEASRAEFFQEISLVEQQSSEKRLANQIYGTEEEKVNKGFYKIKIKNPPEDFVSFSDDEIYGYVVDLELIDFDDESKRGFDYKKFSTNDESQVAEFGVDDIYVYDKKGTVFYVGGFATEDGTYYSKDNIEKNGPEIVSVSKTLAGDKKSATLSIVVRKIAEGTLNVEVDGIEATRTSEEGKEETFEIKVYENKTYKIKATEQGQGTTSSSIEVTEINAEIYTVTYDANGGINAPHPQTKVENVVMKITDEVPEKTGSVFLGWNENASETIAVYRPGSSFTLNQNTRLYAIWGTDEDRTYSVTYNANGGTGAPQTETNLKGEYTISNEIPTKNGYAFDGWATDPKSNVAAYHAGDTITLSENVVLYAVWIRGARNINISINLGEEAGTVTGNGARIPGGEVYVSTTPAHGYTFKNWSVTSGGINLLNTTSPTISFTMPDNDVELVANYEINRLTVRFNSNKGNVISDTIIANYGEEIEIKTSEEPKREGYVFQGWALRQDATEPEYSMGDKFTVYENAVFYAVWAEHVETYTLTYDFNGGAGNKNGEIGKFTPQVKSKGGTLIITEGGPEEPYRLDFTFKGWATTPESTDVVFRAGDVYYKDADLNLYAVWKDEVLPTTEITVKQEEGSEKIKLVGKSHDEGLIAGYAWTTTNTKPVAWETENTGEKDIEAETEVTQKGMHYFWVKDLAGNHSVQSIMVYEIKFDAIGGTGVPDTQYQAENVELTLSSNVLTKEAYVFLGWSTKVNPGNTESDVEYLKGGKIKVASDTILRAVWGKTSFELSSKSGISEIDGSNITITITKGLYTGNITVTSLDPEIATGSENNGILTIVPGTKVGTTELEIKEDRTGYTDKVTVTINKGIRQLTINEESKTFQYGDSSAQIGFSHRGKDSQTTVKSSDTGIAIASVNGKTITITPKNFGTAIITLTIGEDDQYKEKTGEIAVTVTKKELIVTPDSNQKKVYDGTEVTPTLKYSYKGNVTGEIPDFTGALERVSGSDVGKYEIKKGNLALANNGSFLAANYILKLSTTKVYFEITPKQITVPTAITPQIYDGTTKYGIDTGVDYTREGDYSAKNAGKYTAVARLNDSKNFVWSDTQNSTARNISWEITGYDISNGKITISSISDQTYTGNEIMPLPTITFDNRITMQNGTDYTLSYTNNINVGVATITVTGKGNYKGTLTTTFKITKATMQVNATDYTGTFDNKNHTITVKTVWPSTGATIYYSSEELTESNYTTKGTTSPVYHKDAGTYTIYFYITNSNFFDYKGSKKVTINPKSIATSTTITGVTNKEYTGSGITQTITVKENEQNRILVEGTDYTISYSNNVNVGTSTASLIITGKGNFTGTKTAKFSILGDTLTLSKSTTELVSSLTVTITKKISVTTLQYKIDNGAWQNYTGPITITKDCTVYGRSVHNGNTIGTNQITITNICEHSYSTVTCITDSRCVYCNELKQEKLDHDYSSKTPTATYLKEEATCLEKAVYYYKCIRCDEKGPNTYENGEALGHDYTSKTPTDTYLKSAATCLKKAVYYYKCIRCEAKGTNTYENGSALGHNFKEKSITSTYKRSNATCENPETYYYKCTRCAEAGTDYYTNGEKLGHSFKTKLVEAKYLKDPATCTVAAKYYYKCDRCEVAGTETYSSGNPLGHNFTSKTQSSTYLKTAAKCTEDAIYYHKCSRCSAKGTTTYVATGTALGHDWGAYSVTTAAKCTTKGEKTRTCNRCGATSTAEVAALGHDYTATSTSKRSDATCFVAQTNWRKCSRCTSISTTVYYSVGVPLEHDYAAATCTLPATCKRCSTTNGNALGHDYAAATCTLPKTCRRCNATTGTANGHSFGAWKQTTAPTCTDTGVQTKTCSVCNAKETSVIAKLGHNYTSQTATSTYLKSAATCANPAVYYYKCSRCSSKGTTTYEYGEKLPHVWGEYSVTKAATCTATGTKVRSCTRSGCSQTDTATIDKKAHDYKAATCTLPKTCKVCGYESGSANGHSYAAATCTLPKTCTVCGATSGSANGHSWGSYSTTTAATCTATGVKTRYCSVCNKKSTAEIAKLGHDYSSASNSIRSEATCSEAQTNWYKCSRCTSISSSKYYPVSGPLGHSYKAATCTKPKTCTRSGCSATSGSALGHDYSSQTTTTTYLKTAAKCTSAAVYYYKCSRCTSKGSSTYSSGSSLGHSGSTAGNLLAEATCTTAASYGNVCTRCGMHLGTVPVGSPLGHSYKAATCTKPKTCTRCSATSGSSLGHNYAAATCTKPKTCTRCSATSGSSLGHNYAAATCTKAKTCTRCSATSGSSLGHNYAAATCTKAKTCTRCSATSGSKLGHNYSSSYSYYSSSYHGKKCSRCSSYTDLQSHNKQIHHPEDNLYECTKCGYTR